MLIDCPGCARSYKLGDADLDDRGRTVICPRCETRWHQRAHGREIALAAVSTRPSSGLDEPPRSPYRFHPLGTQSVVAAAVVLGLVAFVALVVERHSIVRSLPRSAALYAMAGMPVNVVGLAFASIAPERMPSNDVTIRGSLRNVVGHAVRIPRLAFEVRDAAGAILVAWNESAPAKLISSGREIRFASTPHRLPADGQTVSVHFE